MPSLGLANARIRELELELAQTKLALVETECKNQDLTHQVRLFNVRLQSWVVTAGLRFLTVSRGLDSL